MALVTSGSSSAGAQGLSKSLQSVLGHPWGLCPERNTWPGRFSRRHLDVEEHQLYSKPLPGNWATQWRKLIWPFISAVSFFLPQVRVWAWIDHDTVWLSFFTTTDRYSACITAVTPICLSISRYIVPSLVNNPEILELLHLRGLIPASVLWWSGSCTNVLNQVVTVWTSWGFTQLQLSSRLATWLNNIFRKTRS